MKEIVAKIFGKEASEDEEIVRFYEDVQKIVIEEHMQSLTKDMKLTDKEFCKMYNAKCKKRLNDF